VDLGCGGGRHLRLLADSGIDALGIDASPAAARDAALHVIVQDLCIPLPLDSQTQDLVLMWGVFLHLDPCCHEPVMHEVHRVLRPGGSLLVDFLRPDDFRNRLGRPIRANYNRSPFIQGVTDFFCDGRYVVQTASVLEVIESRDISQTTAQGQRISQGCFWLCRAMPRWGRQRFESDLPAPGRPTPA
jgi:SAM-dependent methyltransferase